MTRSGASSASRKSPPSESPSAARRSSTGRLLRRVHDLADWLTEGLLYLMVIFSPWAFGTTQEWSIGVMNAGGYALGLLLAIKWLARKADISRDETATPSGQESPTIIRLLAAATILIPAYCLISALNARSVYLGDFQYKYFPCVNWLPHSYDARLTWQAFWNYSALALDFWALRDWLKGLDPSERLRRRSLGTGDAESGRCIPARLNRLLWVLSVNGALLAAEGLLQRALGSPKLLWLVEPNIHKLPEEQFGPYAYRSNAAQYFLLLWPVVLGFWQLLRRNRPELQKLKMHNHLLPCILLMALVPFMSLSRAGAFIDAAVVVAVLIVLRQNRRAGGTALLAAGSLLGIAVLLGGYLEWEHLAKRLEVSPVDVSRLELWRNTWDAFMQNPIFGTGPGTFSSVYGFYWSGIDQGAAQAHNDWLELLLTFGIIGAAIVLGALLLILARRPGNEGFHLGKSFRRLVYIGLASCLTYATVDFPLTIYSVLFLFIVECAILTLVSSRAHSVE